MEFYDVLSRYYDRVFPMEGEILAFLRRRFAGRSPLLDVACGTGTYALELAAEPGRVVAGVDLDETMIASAREKAASRGLGDRAFFAAGDMLDLEAALRSLPGPAAGGFAGLSCIGNSLVHLADRSGVGRALTGFAGVLAPGGRLLLQIINFDRVLKKNLRELPTLRGEGVEFVRRYLPAGDRDHVVFETDLVVSGGREEKYTRGVKLLILRGEDLADAAEKAGFRNPVLYGSFGGAAWAPDESFVTILEAERP